MPGVSQSHGICSHDCCQRDKTSILVHQNLHHQAIYLREVNIQKNCLKSNCQLPCAHTQTAHNAKVNGGRSVNPKRLCMIAFQILLIVSNKTNFGLSWTLRLINTEQNLYRMSLNMQATSRGIYSSCLFIVLTVANCIFLYFPRLTSLSRPRASALLLALGWDKRPLIWGTWRRGKCPYDNTHCANFFVALPYRRGSGEAGYRLTGM